MKKNILILGILMMILCSLPMAVNAENHQVCDASKADQTGSVEENIPESETVEESEDIIIIPRSAPNAPGHKL